MQVGDERDVKFDVFERVLRVQHLVVEIYGAFMNLDVGNCEPLRFARRRCRASSLEQVGKIEALLGRPYDMDRWPIDCYLADYGRKPE
jgi:hypothetical protein